VVDSRAESASDRGTSFAPETRTRFLSLARHLRTVTRPELMEHSGLSRAAAYGLAEELCAAGILVPDGIGESRGGRRPQVLRFSPEAWCAVGVELGEQDLRTVLTDLDGRVLVRDEGSSSGTAPEQVVEAVAASVARLRAAGARRRVLGLGFATPGLFDEESGTVRIAVSYGWHDVPLRRMLSERLGLPAFVANRSKAAAVGELHSGAGSGARSLLYVYVGRGIAAGIMLDGELYAGVSSSAGELGHITVEPDGALCECGSRGCLHTVASGEALLVQAHAALKRAGATAETSALLARVGGNPARLTTVVLAEAAREGDAIARELVGGAARYVGIGVGTLINVLNPDRVIVGGPMVAAGEEFLEAIRNEARCRSLAWPFGAARIVAGRAGLRRRKRRRRGAGAAAGREPDPNPPGSGPRRAAGAQRDPGRGRRGRRVISVR
jgi:predicted NBD/HSP70 family sugar kinase